MNEKQQIELKKQKGIRAREGQLVQKIEEALKKRSDKLEESQFRNIVRVALSTESVEVITNFLRYQMGREEKWGRGRNSLAEQIIVDMKSLSTLANEVAEESGADKAEIQLDLIRRYLGYGVRQLKYLRDGNKKEG